MSFMFGKNKYLINNVAKQVSSKVSPLTIAFNSKPLKDSKLLVNVFVNRSGLFLTDCTQTPDGIHFLKEHALNETEKLLEEACSHNRKRNIVQVFDDLSDSICQVADLAEFIRTIHPEGLFSKHAHEVCCEMSSVVEKLNTNRSLYNSIKKVLETDDVIKMTDLERHVARLFLFDFEQCGIHLPEQARKQVVEYNDYILEIGQRFQSAAITANNIFKNSLPYHLQDLNILAEGDIISVSGYGDFPDDKMREAAYKVYFLPQEEQEYNLNQLLSSRYKLSRICGFPTYSHRALNSSIAQDPEFLSKFLDTLNVKLRPRAEADFQIMRNMKKKESDRELAMWDVPYFTHKGKSQWMNNSIQDILPYFSLGVCMEGINKICNQLFGITLKNSKILDGEVWHSDVYKLEVVHNNEGLLGHIYCDLYERPLKPTQDCHYTIRGGRKLPDGSYQNPIVVLVLNLPSPTWTSPTLLTPSMVDNLFHEMGHAIHSMLGRTDFQHVTGTRCTTDFAEVPSILMEYFASDPRVVKQFAKHYMNEEPIPDDLLNLLCSSKRLFSASDLQAQVFYSAVDHEYHSNPKASGNTTKILSEIQKEYYGLPYVENTAWQLRFSHIVGYGAKYYSYLMSKAIASSIWHSYFKDDPFNRAQGEQYRKQCLAHGGGKPARLLIKDYLKRDITPDNIVDSIINDIDVGYVRK